MAAPVVVRVRRQERPDAPGYWETFAVEYRPNLNVIILLTDIARRPVTREGIKSTPVAWECSCLEEVCGSCSMIINGRVRQACTALVDQLEQPITLEPMTKFPVVRDLVVDRSRMFEALKRVQAWIAIDGTYGLGEGPRMAPEVQEEVYPLSQCISCGCCLEACPQITVDNDFVGPAAISQVRLFNAHPTGALHKKRRLDALMGPGGIQDCGNAQNCVRVCPKEIPLTTSIAEMNRQVMKHALVRWLRG